MYIYVYIHAYIYLYIYIRCSYVLRKEEQSQSRYILLYNNIENNLFSTVKIEKLEYY